MKKLLIVFVAFLLLNSCKTTAVVPQENNHIENVEFTPQFIPGSQVIVYKTIHDYNNLVPVGLSDDRSQLVSYPAPNDLIQGTSYRTPVQLHNGYLLDNRGISANVAFIKLTYSDYSKVDANYSAADLYKMIVDKDPLVEMYDCGCKTAFTKEVEDQLNELIDQKILDKKCKKIR